jgi:CheY-like chemotaxis protein
MQPEGAGGQTILMVDDDKEVQELICPFLRENGYTVLSANDGVEAIDILQRNADIKLLFSDIMMPRMDGLELARRARQARPDLKILLATGYVAATQKKDLSDMKDEALLKKPYRPSALQEIIRQMLDRPA